MRVVFVTPFPPKPDGIGEHTSGLVDALRRVDGVRVDVLTSRRPEAEAPCPGVHRILTADPRSTREAAAFVQGLRPDVVHYQFAIPAFGLAGLNAVAAGVRARRAQPDLGIVVTLHEVRRELDLLGPVGRRIYRALVGTADALVVHTSDARDLVVRECGADPRTVSVTPLGAPTPPPGSITAETMAAVRNRYRLTGHEPGGRPLVLCFGYLHPDKGTEDLIGAVARLRARGELPAAGVDVVVAGTVRPRSGVFRYFERKDREYELGLRRAVEHADLGDLVRFVGFVASPDVPPLFASARVAVVPYRKVTQSSVLGTATVAGVPVIASDLPGLREAVGDGGLLFRPGDPGDLARALGQVISDDTLAARLREHQKRRGAETEIDVVASELLGIYGALRVAPSDVPGERSLSAG